MRRSIVAVTLLGAVLLALFTVGRTAADAELGSALSISGQGRTGVAQTAVVEITAPLDTKAVELTVLTGRTTRRVNVAMEQGQGMLLLETPETNVVGTISVLAPGLAGPLAHDIVVAPIGEVSQVELFISGRALLSEQVASADVAVSDRFGNPIADGTIVELSVIHETNRTDKLLARSQGGMASFELPISDAAGDTVVVASAGQVQSAPDTVSRHAAEPLPFQLSLASDMRLAADGLGRIELTSGLVVDRNGAPLPTGTVASLLIVGPRGSAGNATGMVVDGRVRATLIAPSVPGTMRIRPKIRGVVGQELELEFMAAVQPFPYRSSQSDAGYRIEIGPVLGAHGGLVPDGTPADINGLRIALVDGLASTVVPVSDVQPSVTVLGIKGVSS